MSTITIHTHWVTASMEETEHGYQAGGYNALNAEGKGSIVAEIKIPDGVEVVINDPDSFGASMLYVSGAVADAAQTGYGYADKEMLKYPILNALLWARAGKQGWEIITDTKADIEAAEQEQGRRIAAERSSRERDIDRTPYHKGDDSPY